MSRTTNWNHGEDAPFVNNLQELDRLRGEFNSGKLSQSDYLSQTAGLTKKINDTLGYFSSYSGPAWTWAMSQGGQKYLDLIVPEMNVLNTGKTMLGRDLTAQEVAQFTPYFQGPNGEAQGRSALATFAQTEAKNPKNLGGKAQEFSGQIGNYYQDLLKRGATNEEVDYFGRMLATGEVTPYEIQQFIRATPEFQGNQDKAFRQDLSDELGGYDEKAFNRERENILSTYTKAGLQNSSALDYAMTDALSKIQENRGQFLGGLSANQYQGNKEAARSDYQRYLDNYTSGREYDRNRSDSTMDYLLNRAYQGMDYERQKNDYLQFLANQGGQKQNSPWGALAGGLIGAGIGGATGGPAGAGAGYQIGTGTGGYFDFLNRR